MLYDKAVTDPTHILNVLGRRRHILNFLTQAIDMGYSILTLEGLPEDADELADNVTEIYEASRKAKTVISRLNDLSSKHAATSFTLLFPLAAGTVDS